MYSLVNAPVVAFDAARLPAGEAFAEELLAALALDAPRLARLDRRVRAAGGWPALSDVRVEPELQVATVADSLQRLQGDAARGGLLAAARSGAADALARAPFASRQQVGDFVRREVLDWTRAAGDGVVVTRFAPAVELVAAVVAAAYADQPGPPAVAEIWRSERPPIRPGELGEVRAQLPTAVVELLSVLRSLTPAEIDALAAGHEQAAEQPREGQRSPVEPASWAAAIHDATWALHLLDRLRPAAVAQLHAVLVLRRRYPSRLPLEAVAAVTGATQAACAVDVLATAAMRRLVGPLDRLRPLNW